MPSEASGSLEAASSSCKEDVLLHPQVETHLPAQIPSLNSVAFERNVPEPSGHNEELEGQLKGLNLKPEVQLWPQGHKVGQRHLAEFLSTLAMAI